MPDEIGRVRRLAKRHGWVEVAHTAQSRVLGFVRVAEDGKRERCNVYYTTGTVGTALDHPRAGKTQLFRPTVSWAALGSIFTNPRVHTGAGYYRRHSCQRPEPSQAKPAKGMWFRLRSGPLMQAFAEDWNDDCHTLALGEGYFIVGSSGTSWRTVPRPLQNKVKGRQKSLPPVDYVALGPDENYFVQFANGSWQCAGPNSLLEALHRKCGGHVEILAFAPHDGWYVLWEDGKSAWDSLPPRLHNQLNSRNKYLPGVETLAIGPNGEWFVRFLNGSWRADGLADDCQETIEKLNHRGQDIVSMAFGEEWTWAIRFVKE